jgi:transcriptional regulator
MYSPKHYREADRQKILDLMQANEFATVVAYDGERPVASHLLTEVREAGEQILITGHMSRANPLWRAFEHTGEVLTIFQGPHAFISASWYDHVNVPTWNYQSVHAYGKPRLVNEFEAAYEILKRLVDRHEAATSYRLEALPHDFLVSHVKGIVAFEIEVSRLEAASKLSQNRDDANYRNVIAELDKRTDSGSRQVAEAMRRNRP